MKGQIPIFGMVPIEVSSRPDITLSEIRVFNAIASFQGNDNSSFPSLVKISERAGINEVNCSKAIGKLKKKGLVDSQRRYGTSNIYRIIYDFKPLEEIREERKNLLKEARIAKLKNLNSSYHSKSKIDHINKYK